MAIFDFKCDHCNVQMEKIVKFNDVIRCPKCNLTMYKKITAPKMFILKPGIGGFHKPGNNL